MNYMTRTARREISFPVEGVKCRGWVYEPDDNTPRPTPCIVMAHGLGGTRRASLEPYAERFAQAGFVVLVFDYRYLGDSDGAPRQLISPARHLEDWRTAVAWARGLPRVDASRIGLWGTSLSGGHVLVTAARDRSIAAIAAQCPMLDGIASARLAMQRGSLRGLRLRVGAALKDVARAIAGKPPHYVPLVARTGELGVMASDYAYSGCLAIVPPGWRNEVAARIFFSLPLYRPIRCAGKVRCPTLLIACANDTIVAAKSAVEAAARIGDRARLIMLPADHFDIYSGTPFERAMAEQTAFFRSALAGPAATAGTN